ncbi:MAG: aminodeoxychorismate/anthranilate synthase component II [Planctomycetota bacterium]|nr:MAG: aminodeoxychorismate/anthranilate synthase component II [Planctomycetota bacterium]
MILLIDNYDSFTYNVAHALGELNQEIKVFRNDRITVEEAKKLAPEYLVISPGPGRPENAGNSNQLIEEFHADIPILGVCLGHQCIAQIFGGKIVNADRLIHGKTSRIYHDSKTIYRGLRNPIEGGRYHSLIVDENSLPQCLEVAAYTTEGEIMGIRHKELRIEGVQFHPESILTEVGETIFRNFLNGGTVK